MKKTVEAISATCKPYTHFSLGGKVTDCFAIYMNLGGQDCPVFFGKTEGSAWEQYNTWCDKKPNEGIILIDESNMIEGYYNARGWQESNKETVINIGDAVKLWLKDEYGTESIWVVVTDIQSDFMYGTLANNPAMLRFVNFGSPLQFKRDYIMEHSE